MSALVVAIAVLVSPVPQPQFVPVPQFVPQPMFYESGPVPIWDSIPVTSADARPSLPATPEWAQGVRGGPPGRWEIRTRCTRRGCVQERVWVPE